MITGIEKNSCVTGRFPQKRAIYALPPWRAGCFLEDRDLILVNRKADVPIMWRSIDSLPRNGRRVWIRTRNGVITNLYANPEAHSHLQTHYESWRYYD